MKLYCPVHGQWFEGVTVCPIGDCATKLVENWQVRTTGMTVPKPSDPSPAPEPEQKPERKPIWEGVTDGR